MSETMTPKQTLIMWCLLARHGHALQGEIVPKVEKKDREALVMSGYITSEKRNRVLILKAEDKGWHWATEHLHNELPPTFQVLQNLLARVYEFLERSGTTFADFIGPGPESPPDSNTEMRRSPSRTRSAATKKKPLSAAQLRKRIESAYLAVTNGRKAESALLSKVRTHLSDVDRKTVDAGLLRILQGDKEGRKKASLGQTSDPKALTKEDRDAAFSPGGEPFDLLWIQP